MNNVVPFSPDIEPAPPFVNLEAEQELLGAILLANSVYDKVAEFLKPQHFAEPVHERIYRAVIAGIESGQKVTAVSLKHLFERDGALEEIGGSAYLARLAAAATTTIAAPDYARLVHGLAIRRAVVEAGRQLADDASDYDTEPADLVANAVAAIERAAEQGGNKAYTSPIASAARRALEQGEAARQGDPSAVGVRTGLHDLDKKLGGLHRQDLIILAGRPSMGKSALAQNIAEAVAAAELAKIDKGGPAGAVAFFSLEMSADQIGGRLLAGRTGISADRLRQGHYSVAEASTLVQAQIEVERLPLVVNDRGSASLNYLRAVCRGIRRRQKGLALIVVDYLQLMTAERRGRDPNRVQEVSEISAGLKGIAKENDCPVLALSQLSRAVENRDDKRPQLADLRESGAIEQDADVVMFVYREEYYLARKEPKPDTGEYAAWSAKMAEASGLAEIIIGKQRHGPIGTVPVSFDGARTRFASLARAEFMDGAAEGFV